MTSSPCSSGSSSGIGYRSDGSECTGRCLLSGTTAADAEYVFGEIAGGWPLDTFRKEHDAAERDHAVWGVPTFIAGDSASFVRVMTRPDGDGDVARTMIDRVMDLVEGFPELNEFKHTSIPR